jgi:hypothetical protein
MRDRYAPFNSTLCTLKKLIDDFIKHNDTVIDFLHTSGRDYKHADKVIPLFVDTLKQTQFNAALGLDFANILQLSNDKTIFEQYTLSDISNLFASLLKLQDFNLDTYVDAAHFEWSVMDNKEKAQAIANEGIEKAKQKIDELQRVLNSINSE